MNDYSVISFPNLGLQLDPSRGFSLGPLNVHWYGLIIACGLMLAVVYGCKRAHEFGLTADTLTDGVLAVVPFAILCARLYYCVFEWHRYADNPIRILYIWEGGLAIYGGILGAALGILAFCKWKKLRFTAITDLVSIGFLIGQSAGRWGNFFNREAFGGETDSFLKMGLLNSVTGETTYHHPTFLYESVWNLAGLVLLHIFSKKRKYDGQVTLLYVAWYGLGRAMIEGLRTDSLYIPGTAIRVSQLLAIISSGAAVIVLLWQRGRNHTPENLFVNQVKENEK